MSGIPVQTDSARNAPRVRDLTRKDLDENGARWLEVARRLAEEPEMYPFCGQVHYPTLNLGVAGWWPCLLT